MSVWFYLSVSASTPGSLPPAEKLQRRAAAGGDVRDSIGDARLVDRRNRNRRRRRSSCPLTPATASGDGDSCRSRNRESRTHPSARSRRRSSRLRSSPRRAQSSSGRCRAPCDRRLSGSPTSSVSLRRARLPARVGDDVIDRQPNCSPRAFAFASISRATSSLSSSTRELPTATPRAFRTCRPSRRR